MKKKEFIEAVEAATNVAKIKKLVADNNVEIDLAGMNKDDAKSAVLQIIEDEYSELEDDDELIVEEPDEEGEEEPDEEGEEGNQGNGIITNRNKNKKVETLAEKIKRIKTDANRDCDDIVRTVKYLNNITEKDGEYGTYNMGTMTLETPIDGYVAETDEFGVTTWVPGDQTMVFFITSALIATIREDPQMAGVYNKIRDDETLLYQVVANTKFKMLVEYVSANQSWTNPFSRNAHPTPRSYDHDWIAVMPYAVAELGPDAQMWADMNALGGNVKADVVLALLAQRKKSLKSIRR